MTHITETELKIYAENKLILSIRLEPGEKGTRLWITLKGKQAELLLVTQRNQPREWVSVDRLLTHIRETYGHFTSISIPFGENDVQKDD